MTTKDDNNDIEQSIILFTFACCSDAIWIHGPEIRKHDFEMQQSVIDGASQLLAKECRTYDEFTRLSEADQLRLRAKRIKIARKMADIYFILRPSTSDNDDNIDDESESSDSTESQQSNKRARAEDDQ